MLGGLDVGICLLEQTLFLKSLPQTCVPAQVQVQNESLEKKVGKCEGGHRQEITHTFRIKRKNLLVACFLLTRFSKYTQNRRGISLLSH